MDSSPAKRRVLGVLDANASPRPRVSGAEQQEGSYPVKPSSPVKRAGVFSSASEPSPKKRLKSAEMPHALKTQPCMVIAGRAEGPAEDQFGQNQQIPPSYTTSARPQSASPEPSSIFDTSAIDTSQTTNITEDDIIAPSAAVSALSSSSGPRPQTRPRLSREEAREKAEILRLRLGLATYKLRTGQTDLPLETLERKRAASLAALSQSASSWASSSISNMQAGPGGHSGTGVESASAPSSTRRSPHAAPARRESGDTTTSAPSSGDEGGAQRRRDSEETRLVDQTPRRLLTFAVEEEDTNASRGGAASGLLSLARS